MKMEASCSSVTSFGFQHTTRRYVPKDRTLQSGSCFLTAYREHSVCKKINLKPFIEIARMFYVKSYKATTVWTCAGGGRESKITERCYFFQYVKFRPVDRVKVTHAERLCRE